MNVVKHLYQTEIRLKRGEDFSVKSQVKNFRYLDLEPFGPTQNIPNEMSNQKF